MNPSFTYSADERQRAGAAQSCTTGCCSPIVAQLAAELAAQLAGDAVAQSPAQPPGRLKFSNTKSKQNFTKLCTRNFVECRSENLAMFCRFFSTHYPDTLSSDRYYGITYYPFFLFCRSQQAPSKKKDPHSRTQSQISAHRQPLTTSKSRFKQISGEKSPLAPVNLQTRTSAKIRQRNQSSKTVSLRHTELI